MTLNTIPPLTRFYGRRKGRALNATRQAALQSIENHSFALPESGQLNPEILFPRSLVPSSSRHLEIGFGGGEHLIAQAAAHPTIGFIGAEPFEPGIAKCIQQIEERGLSNIKIWPNDARPLLDALAPASLDCIYILFNDPWPKARHADRRFVSPQNLARLARVLKTGGVLKLATDDPGLQAHTEEHMTAQHFFTPAPGLYETRPNWPHTRYEAKAVKAGRLCNYWEFKKIPFFKYLRQYAVL